MDHSSIVYRLGVFVSVSNSFDVFITWLVRKTWDVLGTDVKERNLEATNQQNLKKWSFCFWHERRTKGKRVFEQISSVPTLDPASAMLSYHAYVPFHGFVYAVSRSMCTPSRPAKQSCHPGVLRYSLRMLCSFLLPHSWQIHKAIVHLV